MYFHGFIVPTCECVSNSILIALDEEPHLFAFGKSYSSDSVSRSFCVCKSSRLFQGTWKRGCWRICHLASHARLDNTGLGNPAASGGCLNRLFEGGCRPRVVSCRLCMEDTATECLSSCRDQLCPQFRQLFIGRLALCQQLLLDCCELCLGCASLRVFLSQHEYHSI